MSPPMTRVGSHKPIKQSAARALSGPNWTATSWPSCGEASSHSPIGLGAWGNIDGGTRNVLAEAWDCSTFSSESLPACLGRPTATAASQPFISLFVLMHFYFNLFSRHPL